MLQNAIQIFLLTKLNPITMPKNVPIKRGEKIQKQQLHDLSFPLTATPKVLHECDFSFILNNAKWLQIKCWH